MSTPQRYRTGAYGAMVEDDNGPWVPFAEVNASRILDAALALTPLPDRLVLLDDYAHDLDDTPSVRACKRLAVKMARLGDEEACLLALQHAAAHVGGYAEV